MPANDQHSDLQTAPDESHPPRKWSPRERDLLKDRITLARAAENAYFERSSVLGVLNYLIGVPVVMVTALAGSEIVASHGQSKPVPIWVGIILVSATVLAALQTFFRFGERAAFSGIAGNEYARIRRHIEDALATPTVDPDAQLEEIRKMTEDAGKQSPPIGERRWLTWKEISRSNEQAVRRTWLRALLGLPPRRRRHGKSGLPG